MVSLALIHGAWCCSLGGLARYHEKGITANLLSVGSTAVHSHSPLGIEVVCTQTCCARSSMRLRERDSTSVVALSTVKDTPSKGIFLDAGLYLAKLARSRRDFAFRSSRQFLA